MFRLIEGRGCLMRFKKLDIVVLFLVHFPEVQSCFIETFSNRRSLSYV